MSAEHENPAVTKEQPSGLRSLRAVAGQDLQGLPTLKTDDGKALCVLQVVPAMETGGVERGTMDIARAILAAGGRAIVASSGGVLAQRLKLIGAEHVELPLQSKNPYVMWRNVQRLKKLIVRENVHVVHARSRAPAWSALQAARECQVPFVTTVHAPYNIENGLKRFYNSVMTKGDRVISISHFVNEYINRNYVVDPERIRIIHRGIDVDAFNPDTVSQERVIMLANKWRLPDGVPLLMLPGRLTRWKGQRLMLDALRELGDRDYCCVFVGSDQGRKAYSQELMQTIRDYGLGEKVFITDVCDDMPAAYMLSDIVVSPSTDPEGFGRVVSEGQAMGRAVVASDHGGAREQLLPDVTGFLFENRDVKAFASALDKALSLNEEQRQSLAVAGKQRVVENFSKGQMNRKTLSVYREVAAEYGIGTFLKQDS
ncbi:glycosyltransferase family 4 protein [Kiloniella sp. b19]|uniref:glycosyltransferase family 4 protein n=1 Tax=Kiloniella sp. GXU_MW_B19 TaxID=3141326 RepID=UPI0031DAE1E5